MTKRKWLRTLLIGAVLLLVASFAFSRALRASAARRYLIAHLAASFGRPVDVSWFDFSLLDGARIEAHFVSVSDDPRFGNEYFLRSDTLTAGLRWSALLAGRFEFGSVSLGRPSLNLARDAEGHWNIERWLPPAPQSGSRPGFMGPVPPSRELRATRPARIDVEGGRINFKQGDDKSPFALVDVSGSVEQTGAGRWQLDLEARPMRAGVELQDIGTLRLRGSIAGTSARLQPAELTLNWRAASVADALRLVRENDYGMRGQLAVDVNARIAPQENSAVVQSDSGGAEWSISGVARLTGMHGWRLPEHDSDPGANVSVDAEWRLGEPRAEVRKLVVDLPASRLQGRGDLDWAHGLRPELQIESSTVALGDVLSWYRSLRPDVAEDLRADGVLGLNLKAGGWPIELQEGSITSAGGMLTAKVLPAAVRIGPVKASVSHGEIEVGPTEIGFLPAVSTAEKLDADTAQADSDPPNSFVIRGSIAPQSGGVFRWPPGWSFSIEGATPRVQDWLLFTSTLAQPVNLGWTAAGGLAVKIRGAHRGDEPPVPWLGTMDFLGLTLNPAYVNQPVHLAKAHVEFGPQQRTITLASAEAFGTGWHGSLARKYSDKQWSFDLSADHLNVTELDRWLGPRARPGFLARLTGSTPAAVTPAADAIVTRLAAHGRLRADALDVPPVHLEQLDADAELVGRTIRIRKAQADFFGGKIAGSFEARLEPDPYYEFQGHFDRVDLTQLGGAASFLDARVAGNASATLSLSAHGIGRQDLIGSMEGEGTLTGRNAYLPGFGLSSVFPGEIADPAPDTFASVQATYRIRERSIDLASLVLDNAKGRIEGEGRIDFSHALNLRLHPSIFQATTRPASVSPPTVLLGGTIESPKLIVPPATIKPPKPNPR